MRIYILNISHIMDGKYNSQDWVTLKASVTAKENSNIDALKGMPLRVSHYTYPNDFEPIVYCTIEGKGPDLYPIPESQLE